MVAREDLPLDEVLPFPRTAVLLPLHNLACQDAVFDVVEGEMLREDPPYLKFA